MTRSEDDFKLMVSETDHFIFFKEMTYRRKIVIQLHLIENLSLLLQVLHQTLICCRHFRFQPKSFMDRIVAEIMVKMSMGYKKMNRLKVILLDIIDDGCSFFRIKSSAINDDTLPGFITYHIAILLKHVNFEFFNM